MSMRQTEAMPVPLGLGAMLARMAAGQPIGGFPSPPLAAAGNMGPMFPAQPQMQPAGAGGSAPMDALPPSSSQPLPMPRMASASPGAGGLPGTPMSEATPVVPKPRRSKGQLIAGILADAFAGALGQPATIGPMWQREREQERAREHEQAQWGLQRQAKREDYEWQKGVYAQYPAQRAPHYFEANNGDRYAIGPDGKPQRIFQDTTPKIQFIPNGQGGVIPVNVSAYTQSLTGGRSSAGPAPVLDALPPGAKPLGQGGAGPQTPRTFPR